MSDKSTERDGGMEIVRVVDYIVELRAAVGGKATWIVEEWM